MKIMAFSDLHLSASRAAALVEDSREADLVIGAGDFCTMRKGLPEAMALLDGIRAPFVVVPGNAESADELRAAAPKDVTMLHGAGAVVGGGGRFNTGNFTDRTMNCVDLYNTIMAAHGVDSRIGEATGVDSEGDASFLRA